MTIKPIRWFEITDGKVPPAFHTHTNTSVVVCLDYKDTNNQRAGFEAYSLCRDRISLIKLISEWSSEPLWDQLTIGAQDLINLAALDTEYGFLDGNLYGIFWVQQGVTPQGIVHLGLAYASSTNELTPCQGMKTVSARDDSHHVWVTPQCAIPLLVDVKLPSDQPIRRLSRYERSWVI